MAVDGTYHNGDVTVKIEGWNRVARDLKKSGADMQDMADLMHQIGMIVVNAAHPPVKSGALRSTMRAGRAKQKSVVRAGNSTTVPYGRVQHWGVGARGKNPQNIKAKPFLSDAEAAQQAAIWKALDDGLADIFKKNDL